MPETLKASSSPAPGLPGDYRLLTHEETATQITYTVECAKVPHECPYCRGRPKAWGSKSRKFQDFPRGGKRVEYVVEIRRLRCTQCGKTFLQPLPALNHNHGMTRRLFIWAAQECARRTFSEVGKDLGMEDTSVKALFNNYMKELQLVFMIRAPETLALFPVKLVSKASTAFINAGERMLVDVVPGQAPRDLQQKLEEMAKAGVTTAVALGFQGAYRDAVKEHLPQATIYVDEFFVMDLADRALESARRALRASLEPAERRSLARDAELLEKALAEQLTEAEKAALLEWFKRYPLLREAYRTRELLQIVYKVKRTADKGYAALLEAVEHTDPVAQRHFLELREAIVRWEAEIRAYFAIDASNASLMRIPGLANLDSWLAASNGRGGVFEVARAALLYPPGIPVHTSRSPGTRLDRLKDRAEAVATTPKEKHGTLRTGR